jgi:hypothetical protein
MNIYELNKAIEMAKVWNMTPQERKLYYYKQSHRPENKEVYDKPNDTGNYGTRRRTRPWDNCWFSNKPHIINLTVEQAVRQYPDYMLWCYNNLNIKWSTHAIKLFNSINNRPTRMGIDDLMLLKEKLL